MQGTGSYTDGGGGNGSGNLMLNMPIGDTLAVRLVLSDLHMPRMDGNELARRMKEIAPEVPILLISGSVNAFERATCGDCFLPKGACSPLDVLDRVRMMLARKRGPKKTVTAPAAPSNPNERFEQQHGQALPAFAS